MRKFKNKKLQFLATSEGYFDTKYVYNLSDHLGNNRVSFYVNSSGKTEILEENNFYPFGGVHKGYGLINNNLAYKYKFNLKELQTENDLNVYDFNARVFDPYSAIFWQLDPLVEKTMQPYSFANLNPIRFIDPTGMEAEAAAAPFDWVKSGNQWTWDSSITNRKQAIDAGYDDYAQPGYSYEAWSNFNQKDYVVLGDKGNWNWIPSNMSYLLSDYKEDPWRDNPLARPTIKSAPNTNSMEYAMGTPDGRLAVAGWYGLEGAASAVLWEASAGRLLGGAGISFNNALSSIDEIAVHGNSLLSQKPTWGYKLYSNDGTFLKNGITSKTIPETRYSKDFMSDKYMKSTPFPNRLDAYQWGYQQNLILRGPLNKNMH